MGIVFDTYKLLALLNQETFLAYGWMYIFFYMDSYWMGKMSAISVFLFVAVMNVLIGEIKGRNG